MKLEVSGLQQTLQRIKRISTSLEETSELFQSIGDALEEEAQRTIREQKSATDNKRYAPLSIVTQEKTGKGPRDALKSRHGTTKLISLRIISRDSAELLTTMPYAAVHQYGNQENTFYGRKAPIPRRPFLPIKRDGSLSERMKNKLNAILSDWLARKVNGAD